jgi:histidine decarboxylase
MPFDLSMSEMKPSEIQSKLDGLLELMREAAVGQVGYPGNQKFDYSPLVPFLEYSINNVGDPFHVSSYRANTHEIEREVITHFARLTHIDPEQAWGYVTSGGTEGNMYGLYLARELFPNAMFYFSEDTHYSVLKNVRVLNARYIMIKRQENGEIDYQDLHDMIRVHRDLPAVIMANIGTTVRGAVDDIERLKEILQDLAVSNSYIHADAALSGLILPFTEEPQPYGFDAGIDSISISGHKLIGAPLPCGVVITKKAYVERVGRAVEYVGVHDTTLSGSRNGFAPLMLWYALSRLGEDGLRELVGGMLDTAEYAVDQFNKHGIPAWRHRNSVTVVFPKPTPEVFKKWQIAPEGEETRIVTMPHVTRQMVDELVEDCAG